MISAEVVRTLAKKHQTEEVNIWREYFQHLFLSYFYRQEHAASIYFKGGTALRFIYQSPRFSEDLDFSSSLKDIKKIEQAVISALAEVEREGVYTELQHTARTSGGYLAIMRFKNNGGVIPVQLEISLRAGTGKERGETSTIVGDFIPPYTLEQLTERQIVREKIAALLSRKKPRDFYDFYFILRANLLTEKPKDVLEKILKTLYTTNIRFDRELKRFLPKNHWPVVKDFPAVFEREIKRFL